MIQYTPANQLTLEGFEHPFDLALDPDNRWVKLAGLIDWDELAGIYSQNLKTDKGRLSVDVRMVIGAMIVKHKLKLTDRETVVACIRVAGQLSIVWSYLYAQSVLPRTRQATLKAG